MNGMERTAAATEARIVAQAPKHLIGQVLEPCAAINQQQLSKEGAKEQVGARRAVAPAFQLGRDAFLGVIYRLAAERARRARDG